MHYDAATGHLWFATQSGGLWVVELEPQVRRQLGPHPVPAAHPDGNPPRVDGTVSAPASAGVATEQYYCTLGSVSL